MTKCRRCDDLLVRERNNVWKTAPTGTSAEPQMLGAPSQSVTQD